MVYQLCILKRYGLAYAPNPDWTGSFYNEWNIGKKIQVSCLLDISMGGHIANYTKIRCTSGGHMEILIKDITLILITQSGLAMKRALAPSGAKEHLKN